MKTAVLSECRATYLLIWVDGHVTRYGDHIITTMDKSKMKEVDKTLAFNSLQSWLIVLSIIFISFFGIIIALICIFALPDKSVRPLFGSFFFLGSSALVGVILFLRWRKEKIVENENVKDIFYATLQKIGMKESTSDKIIKWFITIYAFIYTWCGFVLALICIYALPDKTSQPMTGMAYFSSSAAILGCFIYVVWKNWTTKNP